MKVENNVESPVSSGEVHVFRSLAADRAMVYHAPANGGGGHPLVCQLKNGEILAVFQAWDGQDEDWHLMSARSTDEGLHWSRPQVLVDSSDSEGNPSLGVLEDGTVVLGYETWHHFVPGTPARFISYDVIRSTDHGHAWNPPVKIQVDHPRALASYSRIIPLPNGTALLPLYSYLENGREDENVLLSERQDRSYVYRSKDGGKSWGERSLIARGFNETNLVYLESGKLMAALREQEKPPGRSAVSESTDGGHAWSPPRFVTGASEHPATLAQSDDGTVVLSYGVRHPPYGAQAILSHDDGQTWDPEHKIMIGFDSYGSGGYPCTIRLDSGYLLTLYYGYGGMRRERFAPFVEAVRWALAAR